MVSTFCAANEMIADSKEMTPPEIMNHLRPKMSLRPPASGSDMVDVIVLAVSIQL
jgi:hypothetical protein